MKRERPAKPGNVLERISVWTLIHHDFLVIRIRIYMWSASFTILFFAVAGIIPLRTALYLLLFCGCGIMLLLWSLIQWRRSILLGIQDEKLRLTAHAAMLRLISARQPHSHQRQIKKGYAARRYTWDKSALQRTHGKHRTGHPTDHAIGGGSQ